MGLKIAWLITSSETARTRDAAVDIVAEFFPFFFFFFLFFFPFPGARFGYRFYSVAVEFNCLLINARPIINSRHGIKRERENYDRYWNDSKRFLVLKYLLASDDSWLH